MSINLETGQHKLTKVKKNYQKLRKITQLEVHLLCCAKPLQLCSTLCNSVDSSPPDSSVHGILRSRIPEWAVMPSSRGSSQPRDQTCVSYISCIGRRALISPLAPPGRPVLLATASCFLPYRPYLASNLCTCQGAHTSLTAGAGDAHTGSESLFCASLPNSSFSDIILVACNWPP